jgi:GNAT superfamily N-acetyltransferase
MFGLQIRDGLTGDVAACIGLDHTYTTEMVWQMSIQQATGQWTIAFKTERLPRTLETSYPANADRVHLAAVSRHCFLVAVNREDQQVIGYLTMRRDPVHGVALVQDLVVSRPFRRGGIATRLLGAARQWGREHEMLCLTVEVQTKNYPAIQFCQNAGLGFCGFNDRYFENQDIAVFFSQALR